MEILQVTAILIALGCAVLCFVGWRASVSGRREHEAKAQLQIMEAQARFSDMSLAHKKEIIAEISELRSYVEEMGRYRDSKESARDQRLRDVELVVRTLRRLNP